jgi:hypothetical protein
MDVSTVIKCVIIALLIFAGYYVVRSANKREGFSLGSIDNSNNNNSNNSNNTASSSADTPNVVAEKSVDIINKSTMNIIGTLQVDNGRTSYEGLIEIMDVWTQAKVLASLNALAAQMIADSSDQNALVSPPSDKTVALMNAINTMINLHGTSLPAAMKYLDNA